MNRPDFSTGLGCIEEARDVLRYLVRECGAELATVHAGEAVRPESGLTGHQNALELVARALSLTELARGELLEAEETGVTVSRETNSSQVSA